MKKKAKRNEKGRNYKLCDPNGTIASYSLKMMQPRTTGTCHRTLSNFFFSPFSYKSCWPEVSDIFWPSNFTPFSPGARRSVFFLLPLLGVQLNDHRMTWTKIAMIAALIRPEMGTVTNHAMKMFLNRRQSTAFFERSQPTATTEPTYFR